ncbi:MAG: helix-turn-helix domain-containing protein [Thermoplasmata archaeon]
MATRVKLYPNEKQKVLLEKHFGSCRFVYNHFLEERDRYYITHKDAEKSSFNYIDTQTMLLELKKEYPWLYEVNSQSLQLSLRFLENAFKNFFHKNAEHPRFRKKGKNDYFAIPQRIKIEHKENRIDKSRASAVRIYACGDRHIGLVRNISIQADVGL